MVVQVLVAVLVAVVVMVVMMVMMVGGVEMSKNYLSFQVVTTLRACWDLLETTQVTGW